MKMFTFSEDAEANKRLNAVAWNLREFFGHSTDQANGLVAKHNSVSCQELSSPTSPYRLAAYIHFVANFQGDRFGFAMWSAAEGHDQVPERSLAYYREQFVGANKIRTNRDFYLAILDLIERQRGASSRSLEKYLTALWSRGLQLRDQQDLTAETVFSLLCVAFDSPVPPFNEAWRANPCGESIESSAFGVWEDRIIRQIVDLREMDEAGTLDNEHRYLGVQSPRGSYWFNFDPCTYCECATVGSFGGWQSDDNSGRMYVPGEVAVTNESGEITTCNPEDVDNPIYIMQRITWEDFSAFLSDGQLYE